VLLGSLEKIQFTNAKKNLEKKFRKLKIFFLEGAQITNDQNLVSRNFRG
jgi:hypothetical protein